MQTGDVAFINKQLEGAGKFEDGRALFRVVWSETQIEKRRGTFSKYSESGIWLCEEENVVKEVKKYNYLDDRWILEILTPRHGNEELVTKTSYEPIFVFQDKDGGFLPPNLRVCEIIINRLRNRLSVTQAKIADEDAERKREEKEIEEFEAYLEDAGSTVIGSHLSTRSGVVSPGIEPILPAKKEEEV